MKKLFYIIFSYLLTISIFLNLDSVSNEELETVVKGSNWLTRMAGDLVISLQGNYNIYTFLVFFAIYYLLKYVYSAETFRFKVSTMLLAMFLGCFMVIGYSFANVESLELVLGSVRIFLKALFVWTGNTILIYTVITFLFGRLESINVFAESGSACSLKFWKIWGLILAAWGIYIVIFFPAISTADAANQIAGFLGYDNTFYAHTSHFMRISGSYLTDHHPIMHTFFIGALSAIGLKAGSIYIGLFLICIIQVLVVSFSFAYAINYLKKINIKTSHIKIVLYIAMFFPLFPLYAFTIVKNTLYCAFLLLYTIQLMELVHDTDNVLKSKKWMTGFITIIMLQMFIIKHGMHVVLLSGIILIVLLRKYYRKLVPVYLITILLFKVVFTDMLLPAINVTQGDPKEVYSIFFQQTARYVITYEDEVTQEEKDILDKVFFYDLIEEKYEPEHADGIKFLAYRYDTVMEEDLDAYFGVWWAQFKKHPWIYVEATLNNMYGYFYPNLDNRAVSYYDIHPKLESLSEEAIEMHSPESLAKARDSVKFIVNNISKLPIIGFFFRGTIEVWVLLLLVVYVFQKKNYMLYIPIVPSFLQVLVCIASPVNAYVRYMLPISFTLPFLLLYVQSRVKAEQEMSELTERNE